VTGQLQVRATGAQVEPRGEQQQQMRSPRRPRQRGIARISASVSARVASVSTASSTADARASGEPSAPRQSAMGSAAKPGSARRRGRCRQGPLGEVGPAQGDLPRRAGMIAGPGQVQRVAQRRCRLAPPGKTGAGLGRR